MDIETLRTHCLGKAGVEESFPFGELTMVFKVGDKIFLLASLGENKTFNAKCDPDHAVELREMHSEVTPGYHMNKKHWNTVDMQGRLTKKEMLQMIDESYELVFKSLPRKKQEEISG